MNARLQHQAQTLAARLPPLLIEAEQVAHAVQQGIHGRRRAGSGETFWQFRRYEQGDPIERIDWRQSARTDKIFVREREYEAAQNAYLWADASPSMDYSSSPFYASKIDRARLLMLALAELLLRGGEKVTWLDQDNVTAYGRKGLDQIAAYLQHNTHSVLLPDGRFAARAHMVMCSDFLMPLELLEQKLRSYAALQLRGALVHILDPLEDDFALDGRIELQGCEGENPLMLPNAAALRDAYRQKLAAHKARLEHIARSAGWFYLSHVTSQPPQQPLTALYQRLAKGQR